MPGTISNSVPGTIHPSATAGSYSIGRPDALFNLITPVVSTKKIRVPVVPDTAGVAVHVNVFAAPA